MTRSLLTTALAAALLMIGGVPPGAGADDGETLAHIQAGKRDVCAVCGMFVAKHPEWLAEVVYEDGSRVFFDGPKDLFVYLLTPERYGAAKRGVARTSVRVTSYYEGAATPAEAAFYVLGSDVLGPMGAELVPHRTIEEAEEFARDHHGERIVRFDEVTRELLNELQ